MFAFRMGISLGLGLIAAIGAQNVFLIKQGVKNEYAIMCALVCIACDVFLITLSVLGVHHLIDEFPLVKQILTVLGVGFLLGYGVLALRRSFQVHTIKNTLSGLSDHQGATAGKMILIAISFSLLNPHAILDTVILIGGFASQYDGMAQYEFMLGTIAASIIWFSGLVLVSRFASRYLMSPRGWQFLEFTSGLIMLALAVKLAL